MLGKHTSTGYVSNANRKITEVNIGRVLSKAIQGRQNFSRWTSSTLDSLVNPTLCLGWLCCVILHRVHETFRLKNYPCYILCLPTSLMNMVLGYVCRSCLNKESSSYSFTVNCSESFWDHFLFSCKFINWNSGLTHRWVAGWSESAQEKDLLQGYWPQALVQPEVVPSIGALSVPGATWALSWSSSNLFSPCICAFWCIPDP